MSDEDSILMMLRFLELRQIAFENVIQETDPDFFAAYRQELSRQIDKLVQESPELADLIRKHLKQ